VKAPLPEFLMENWLESHRFSARFNAGESGHVPHTLGAFLEGLQADFPFSLKETLLEESLQDAPNMGLWELRERVAALHPGACPENVLITTGTSEALLLLLRQLKPRKVAVLVPAFQLLTEIPRSLGASIVPLPVHWDEKGHPVADIAGWCALLKTENPDVFLLNHPHNPSGLVFNDSELKELCAAAESVGCVVVGDEHYRFLSEPTPRLGRTVYSSGRFVTGSFIKCTGTPGLRIGWCVGDPRVLEHMQSEKNYLTHTVNPLSQRLALWFLQSYQGKNSFFSIQHGIWLENRDAFSKWLLSQNQWKGCAPAGGLVTCLFPKSDELQQMHQLLERGVFLLPLSTFMESSLTDLWYGDGFRLGLGLPPTQFAKMLSVMVL
jgi:aspartate/methionine/tyrosine aminotransferase